MRGRRTRGRQQGGANSGPGPLLAVLRWLAMLSIVPGKVRWTG